MLPGEPLPSTLDAVQRLNASGLRKLLGQLGVDVRGCVEKGDFVALAFRSLGLDAGVTAQAASMPPNLCPTAAALDAAFGFTTIPQPPPPCGPPPPGPLPPMSGNRAAEPQAAPEAPPTPRSPSLRSDWSDDVRPPRSPSSSSSPGRRGRGRTAPEAPVTATEATGTRPADWGTDTVRISGDEAAALAIGSGGKSKDKIAKASGAEIELNQQECSLKVSGSETQRRRARKYTELLTKRGGGAFSQDEFDDGDLTVVRVPPDVVGYVQGHGGSVLRNIEDEWNTLMVFVDSDLSRAQRIAIFGSVRGRRGAELKVLSAIETKSPGYFNNHINEIISRDRGKDHTGTWGTDYMPFKDEGEISYALGKQGGTRRKLERSTGAVVQYVGMVCICSGTNEERKRVREYLKWLFQQLEGPVFVEEWESRGDCTVVDIPSDCIGYITGNKRATLGSLEEEWGTLMFFMNETERMSRNRERQRGGGGTEKLAIFGCERPRRGSELKVMSGIETKSPGTFTRGIKDKMSDRKGFDTDRLLFKDDEVSYALGKDGATRKKLECAAGAILQYVGQVAYIAGNIEERRRCREFVVWLLQQRRGYVTIADTANRTDVTEVHIPASCKGWVTGNRGSELRRMEQVSATYMFMALDAKGEERLLIFSHDAGSKITEGGRCHGERLVRAMIEEKLRDNDSRRELRRESRSRSKSRRRSRSKSRRRRRRSRSR